MALKYWLILRPDPQFFLPGRDNGQKLIMDPVRQWVWPVSLENLPGLLVTNCSQGFRTSLVPELAHPPVDILWTGEFAHIMKSVILSQEVTTRTYAFDHVYGQSIIVNRNSLQHLSGHGDNLIIHHQLTETHGQAHLQHPPAVNHIGTCQGRQQGSEGFFMARLSVG